MSDDAVLAALTGLNERLDRLEAKVDAAGGGALSPQELHTLRWLMAGLGNLKERAPVLNDAVAGVANHTLHSAAEAGIDPVDTGLRALGMLQRAAAPQTLDLADRLLADDAVGLASKALSPETVALLNRAIAHPELIEFALEFGLAMHAELAHKDVPILASKIGRLTALLDAPELEPLLAAGALDAPLGVVADATTALTDTRNAGASQRVGPFGAFFKLMDADVQKAIGFTLAIAKRFGSRLP